MHKIWIHREVDRYFVATDHVKELMVDIGVPAEQIVETGIPIRSSFELKVNPKSYILNISYVRIKRFY